jgi:hypothetical protein
MATWVVVVAVGIEIRVYIQEGSRKQSGSSQSSAFLSLQPSQQRGQNPLERHFLPLENQGRIRGMAPVVEHFSNKCEALSSIPSTGKKKKKKENQWKLKQIQLVHLYNQH